MAAQDIKSAVENHSYSIESKALKQRGILDKEIFTENFSSRFLINWAALCVTNNLIWSRIWGGRKEYKQGKGNIYFYVD